MQEYEDEIDLLDLLAIIAEYWKVLVFVPLLVAAMTFSGASIWPKKYESVASVTVPYAMEGGRNFDVHRMASILESQGLKIAVLKKLGEPVDDVSMERLDKSITVKKDRSNVFLTVSVRAESPDKAQHVLSVVLDQLYLRSRPQGEELTRLENRLQGERDSLAQSLSLEKAIAQRLAGERGAAENLSRAYAELLRANGEKRALIARLEAEMEGVSPAQLLQPPSVPYKPVSPKRSLITVLSALAAGMLVLLAVLVRHAWVAAAARPENAEKLQRIRMAFGLSR